MDKPSLTRVMAALGLTIQSENKQWLNCSCPFASATHKNGTDNSASFGVRFDDRGRSHFKCYACKAKGTLLQLVMRLAKLRNRDYSALITEVRGIEGGMVSALGEAQPFDRPEDAPSPLVPLNEAVYDGLYPRAWDVPVARAYLETRGIGEATADALGLLYREYVLIEDKKNPGQMREWHRRDILFPVRDRDGRLYGWTARTTRDADGIKPKVFDADLPKRHLILGEHRWREGFPKLIVEGLFGYAWLIEIGAEEYFDIGALMGSLLTPEKATLLRAWECTVLLLLDNDEAGDVGLFGPVDEEGNRDTSQAAVDQLIDALVVQLPAWPEGKADPDELTLEEVCAMMLTPPAPPPRISIDKHSARI